MFAGKSLDFSVKQKQIFSHLFLFTLLILNSAWKFNVDYSISTSGNEVIRKSKKILRDERYSAAKPNAEIAPQTSKDKTELAKSQLQQLKTSTSKTPLKKADRQKIDALYNMALNNAVESIDLQQQINEVMIAYCERDNQKAQLSIALKRKLEIDNAIRDANAQKEKNQLQQMQQQLTSLLDTNNALGSQIVAQRNKISNMSAMQAKTALQTALQKQLLDSMAMVSLVDSIRLQEQSLILQNQADSLSRQQTELRVQKSQRNLFIIIAILVLLVAVGLFYGLFKLRDHNLKLNEKNELIQKEKQHNEELLLNILPKAISDELKEYGVVRAKRYESVSVLFSDFVNFSQISEKLTPEDLVRELDYCFKQFDKIVVKNGLEKIKTIGDAYMCAGGLPEDNDLHAEHAVLTAIEMQKFLTEWNAERRSKDLPEFHARIGINTGPLVAGVVGIKKFAYDIWGDTVNVASRMESSCEADKINISGNTYMLVRDKFNCIYRGKLPIKNRGEIDMYFVSLV